MDYEISAAGQQTAGRQMRKTGTKNHFSATGKSGQ